MFTRPKTIQHAILGRYKLWLHRGGCARVGRFQDLDGVVFYAQVRKEAPWGLMWDMISRHRKLSAAKRAVEDYLTRNGARQCEPNSSNVKIKRTPRTARHGQQGLSRSKAAGWLSSQSAITKHGANRSKLVALLRDGCPPSRSLARSQ
jgi:hypothetical protein